VSPKTGDITKSAVSDLQRRRA